MGLWNFLKGADEAPRSSRKTGERGERRAERFLRREKGFRIVVRNWRAGRDELDLVVLDGNVLVFVEVKTRSIEGLVPAYYSVNERKKKALRRVIRSYLRSLNDKPLSFRFDVVEIILSAPEGERILHFENIPLFSKNFRAK